MKISIVVAIGEHFALGKEGNLLWHLPNDMARFKEITYGHHVLMGRKTYESIPPKFRPLKGRPNVIVTRQEDYKEDGCKVVRSVEEGIDYIRDMGEQELMVIGGGEIYKHALPFTDCIYLTQINAPFPEADTFFPELNFDEWTVEDIIHHHSDEKHQYNYTFSTLNRKPKRG